MADKKKVELKEENLEEVAGGAVGGVDTKVKTKVGTVSKDNADDSKTTKNVNSQTTTDSIQTNNTIKGQGNKAGAQVRKISLGDNTNIKL